MGLLDKAGKMQNEEKEEEVVAAPEPEVEEVVEVKKRERRSRRKSSASTGRKKRERGPKTPRELPDDFVKASKPNRFARWLFDFLVNWGLIFGVLFYYAFVDSGTGNAWMLVVLAILIPIGNIIVMPIMTNRTMGNFMSRTKFITYKSKPPLFVHQILYGLGFPLILFGIFVMGADIFNIENGAVRILVGFCFWLPSLSDMITKIVMSEKKQGLYDLIFGAYLVHHIPTGSEKGWLAKLEKMGDFAETKFKLSERSEKGEEEDSSDS